MRISDWSSDVFSSELDHPSYQQHDDGQEVVEEGREAEILFDLLEQWPRGGEAGAGEPPGLQEISGGQRTPTCGKSRLRERAKDDVAERREAVQDEHERTDVEDIADTSAEHLIPAAQRPEQPWQRAIEIVHGGAAEGEAGRHNAET